MDPLILTSQFDRNQAKLYYGQDVRESLKQLPDRSVHMACTSPPYLGLRDYGTATWEGGDPNCDHGVRRWEGPKQTQGAQSGHAAKQDALSRQHCVCGARRVDQQIGLEETPEAYVQSLVDVFRELWRVLRDDGTLWLNLGDSYAGYRGNKRVPDEDAPSNKPGYVENMRNSTVGVSGFKPKDLMGIPWTVALALRSAGWYLRQDIIWHKPQCMPESVTDRCTKAHEYLFLLTKKPDYFYDYLAVREPCVSGASDLKKMVEQRARISAKHLDEDPGSLACANPNTNIGQKRGVGDPTGRNRRSVWSIRPSTYHDAHFATWPEDLVEVMIKAGTSEKGCCPTCGAQWERVTESCSSDPDLTQRTTSHYNTAERYGSGNGGNSGFDKLASRMRAGENGLRTTGWQPTCNCPVHKPVPCTVLDPFSGSATTGKVAWDLGRDYIGIDLNPDYLPLAQGRLLGQPSGVFQEVEKVPFEGLW